MASQQELAANVRSKTYLISRHGFALRVTKDGTVEASGCGTSDPFTILEMISVGPGEIVLRGESANRYIGMSPDGDLLTYNSLIEDCVFKEHHNMNGYSSFESRPYSGWFLALTNEGRAKPGPKTAPYQRAVEFLTGKVGQNLMGEPKQLIPGLFRLRSRHGHFLRVGEIGVSGTKDENDDCTFLEMESVAQEGIAIRGKSRAKYIGIDTDGNLSTYDSFTEDCIFIEQPTQRSGYNSFASRSSVGFYLGLRKDGRPKSGRKTAPGQKAIAFTKTVISGRRMAEN